jgi:agmatinase
MQQRQKRLQHDSTRSNTKALFQMIFGDLPEDCSGFADSLVAILPVAYDETSTWTKGSDKGPEALLAASGQLELYDIATDSEAYRKGIFTDAIISCSCGPETMVNRVQERVTELIAAGKFVVTIGGEHSVSIGAVRAHAEKYDDLCVLQLDAHADLRREYDGSPCSHACVMARVAERCPIVQVGIRSMDISEKNAMVDKRVFLAENMQADDSYIDGILSRLGTNVYITLDLDVFDPSIMPSTGTPEPGGLLWYPVLALLKTVIAEKCLVGFDIVELCPNEHNRAPDFLAAKLLYKILSYRYAEPPRQEG